MISQKRPIAVDLFAGAGGMTLGFEQAGFDVLASVEIDPIHCAVHEYNFPFWQILCRSVVDTTGDDIRRLSTIGDKDIDVVFGGSPCQGFSIIGKRFLEDSRNDLIYHYIRLVLELQPKFFVLENVKGLTFKKHRSFLIEIINQFEKNNYEVYKEYKVLNAAEYGIPQNRERLFLLGCRNDLKLPNYPLPITKSPKSKKTTTNEKLPLSPTVWDALQDLPEVNNYPELEIKDWIYTNYNNPSNYALKLRFFENNEEDHAYSRNYDLNLLTSSLRTKHTPSSIKRFAETKLGKVEKISRFYKLSPDGLCNTLRAGTPSDKGSYTAPRPIHYSTPRCITVREAARLHSYPDWFRFHVTKWHGFRQVGNSVPPLLAKAIAREIIKALEIQPLKPTEMQSLGSEKLLSLNPHQASRYYEV